MSLRVRLTVALVIAAVLPMAVALGWPLLRAERRARERVEQRLDQAVRQGSVLLEQQRRDLSERLRAAGRELIAPGPLQDAVLGREGESAARGVGPEMAARHGLDLLQVLARDGTLLSSSDPGDVPGLRGSLAGTPEEPALLSPAPGRDAPALAASWTVPAGNEALVLAGVRSGLRGLASSLGELTGAAVTLVEDGTPAPAWSRRLSLGAGWSLGLAVEPPDVVGERRELVLAFAGVAPLALGLALIVGFLLAETIARPIRALAERADGIARERIGLRPVAPEPDEVRRLTAAFDRMLEALARSERQRALAERVAAWEEVARRLAHEIKNPLSPIKLAVENLGRIREKAPAELTEAVQVEGGVILEEVESLRRIADEFSQFARLPRPQPADCDLRAVVSQALALYAPRIAAQGVVVEQRDAGVPVPVRADAEQVARVLKNVVANALDALDGAPERRLAVTLAASGEDAVIEVADTGAGLSAETARRIFEPYYTTRAERGGTGLGMAIAWRIVTEHGGRIRAEGAPGAGTRITIALPASGPPGTE